MFHVSRRFVFAGALLFILAVVAVVALQPQAAAGSIPAPVDNIGDTPPQQGIISTTAQYLWSYTARFVCGVSDTAGTQEKGELPVKPGNYATTINTHNSNYRLVPMVKKVVVLYENGLPIGREKLELQTPPRVRKGTNIGPDFAMMDDCNALWMLTYQTTTLPSTMPLLIGDFVIISPLDLDVDAVFTAQVPATAAGGVPTGISIDVERIPGKRIFVPANTLP